MKLPALPASVKKLFWDTDVRSLHWARHRDAIIGRVLWKVSWREVKEGLRWWVRTVEV
jgi:hypothetical protein